MCSAFNGKNILFLDFHRFFETGVFIWFYINVYMSVWLREMYVLQNDFKMFTSTYWSFDVQIHISIKNKSWPVYREVGRILRLEGAKEKNIEHCWCKYWSKWWDCILPNGLKNRLENYQNLKNWKNIFK